MVDITGPSATPSAVIVLRHMPGASQKKPCREAGLLRLLQSTALQWSIADWSLDQGCCGSLPLLKVSSGSQVAQKCWVLKVLKGFGPCGVSSPAGVSDWT
jgi:hypothetical protein